MQQDCLIMTSVINNNFRLLYDGCHYIQQRCSVCAMCVYVHDSLSCSAFVALSAPSGVSRCYCTRMALLTERYGTTLWVFHLYLRSMVPKKTGVHPTWRPI